MAITGTRSISGPGGNNEVKGTAGTYTPQTQRGDQTTSGGSPKTISNSRSTSGPKLGSENEVRYKGT